MQIPTTDRATAHVLTQLLAQAGVAVRLLDTDTEEGPATVWVAATRLNLNRIRVRLVTEINKAHKDAGLPAVAASFREVARTRRARLERMLDAVDAVAATRNEEPVKAGELIGMATHS